MPDRSPVLMLHPMLLSWLNAREAVRAGSTLADSFPAEALRGKRLREFVDRATNELQSLRLNLYKRARFANAFKWRLLEKGVQAEVAAEVTQTLLVASITAGLAQAARSPDDATQGAVQTPVRSGENPGGSAAKKPQAALQLAQRAYAAGDFAAAAEGYTEYLKSRPRDAVALTHLGTALRKLGRDPRAQEQFRKAIAANPQYSEAHANLGSLYLGRGLLAEAENSLRRAVNLKPGNTIARTALGLTLSQLGRVSEARTELEKVLRVTPTDADALYAMGVIAVAEGRFAEGDEFFTRALAIAPEHTYAWSAQAHARKMTSEDKIWVKRAEQTAQAIKAPTAEATMRFAIGKYYDDVGDYAKAFSNYARANELLKRIAAPYDGADYTRFVDAMTRIYTPEVLTRTHNGASSSNKPILVVGMMRSGTTLIEQILASHPKVGGAGELLFWNNAARKYDEQLRSRPLADSVTRKLAEGYLQTLSQRCPDAAHVVDKTPLNFDYLGVIRSALPNARIIYARRDPLDTCLSCYFQPFPVVQSYAMDLEDLYHHYSEHARLAAHWQKALPPGTLLEVPYEELVANQEEWTRKILAFVGLDWDERCLQFHNTQRAVITASNWQVRQPIYRRSVQRWRNYAQFIDPLRKLNRAA